MNRIVFFSTLFIITISLFSGETDKKFIDYGHMLPPMSPRTCQEYLEWKMKEKQQNEQSKNKYPKKDRRYALRCSNETRLTQSSDSIEK